MRDDLDHHQYDRNTVDQLSSDVLVLFFTDNDNDEYNRGSIDKIDNQTIYFL